MYHVLGNKFVRVAQAGGEELHTFRTEVSGEVGEAGVSFMSGPGVPSHVTAPHSGSHHTLPVRTEDRSDRIG